MKSGETTIPQDSLTQPLLPADYTDAFRCDIPPGTTFSPDDLMVSFWTVMPGWVNALFKLRNLLVKPFGLKGGGEDGRMFAELERAIRDSVQNGMVTVPAKNGKETVLKLSDKHLDAYISVYLEKEAATPSVTAITVVRYHNRLGKMYFFFIRPFHKVIVKSMMKSTIQRLLSAGG